MSTNRFCIILLLTSVLAVGCLENATPALQTEQRRPINTYAKAELDEIIVRGMTAAEVVGLFGLPGFKVQLGPESFRMTYSFPLDSDKPDFHLTGFSIYFEVGKVTEWHPIMGETVGMSKGMKGGGSNQVQSFDVFLMRDSLTNVVSKVIVDGSVQADIIEIPCDLSFEAEVFAGRSGSEPGDEHTVILVVSEIDAARLKELSEDNVGSRLLIACGDRVVAAPAISAPLVSRKLVFTVKNADVLGMIVGR